MQYDVYANPSAKSAEAFPLVVVGSLADKAHAIVGAIDAVISGI